MLYFQGNFQQELIRNYKELANLTGKEWKKLLMEGGIELDEKHQKLLDNIGKDQK